jgi:hypothetical protein
MNLNASFDRLEKLILDGVSPSELSPLLSWMREQSAGMEQLANEVWELETAYAQSKREWAQLEAQLQCQHGKAMAELQAAHVKEVSRIQKQILQLNAQSGLSYQQVRGQTTRDRSRMN